MRHPASDRCEAPGLRFEAAGLLVCTCFAGLVFASYCRSGGAWIPPAVTSIGIVVAAIAGAHACRLSALAVPGVVALLPIIVALVRGAPLLDADALVGPAGYSNASGSLFFIAACAAGWLGQSLHRLPARAVAHGLVAAWIVCAWWLGATAATALSLFVPVISGLVWSRPRLRRLIVVTAAGATLAGLAFAAALGSSDYEPGEQLTAVDRLFDRSLSGTRVLLWREATRLIARQPLLGTGPGRFGESVSGAAPREYAAWAHNEYLELAAENGVPALFVSLALLSWLIVRLWRARDPRAAFPALALGGAALHANIDFVLHFPIIPLSVAAFAGAAAAAPTPAGAPHARGRTRLPHGFPATVLLTTALLIPVRIISVPPSVPNGAVRFSGEGIAFPAPGLVRSADVPRELYREIRAANAFSIEVTISSRDTAQTGPARIVSSSSGTDSRNFTIGQQNHGLVFRLRTTNTDLNGVQREIVIDSVFATPGRRRVRIETDLREVSIHVDGALRWTGDGPGGTLDNWDLSYPLLFGNEVTGDRPWRGTLHAVAVRASLSADTPAASPAGEFRDDAGSVGRLLARYSFERGTNGMFSDESGSEAGPALVLPARIPGSARPFSQTLLSFDGWSALQGLAHAILFGLWGVAVLRERIHWTPLRAYVSLIGGGLAIAMSTAVLRYLLGRSPSVADLVAAVLGCSLALLFMRVVRPVFRRRSRPGEPAAP